MASDDAQTVLPLDAGPVEAEIGNRLGEFGDFTQEALANSYRAARGVMWLALDEHRRSEGRCATCGTTFPCPAVTIMSRILRVPELLLARAAANAVAEQAKERGANVLTVLRRPELDVFAESGVDWDASQEELFGFEIVLPGCVVALRIPGGPRPRHRREYDRAGAVDQVCRAGRRHDG